MNKTVIIGFLLLLSGCNTLKAQETDARRNIISRVQYRNDSLHISLAVPTKHYFIRKNIKSNMAVRMDLNIQNLHTGQKINLPPIVVQGKRYASFAKRNHRLQYGQTPMPVAMYIDSNKLKDSIRYAVALPFSKWLGMPTTQIGVMLSVHNGCCGHQILSQEQLPFAVGEYQEVTAVEAIPQPKELSLRIYYVTGQYDVLPYLDQNEQELARLDAYLKQYGRDITARRITITGYCSVEGTKAFNDRLGKERAERFKRYMMARYGLTDSQIYTDSASEDWAKLREYVAAGNLPYKYEVLRIIDTVPIYSGRKAQLMKLDGGRPYREMLQYIFPKLRRVYVEVKN